MIIILANRESSAFYIKPLVAGGRWGPATFEQLGRPKTQRHTINSATGRKQSYKKMVRRPTNGMVPGQLPRLRTTGTDEPKLSHGSLLIIINNAYFIEKIPPSYFNK